MTFELQSIVATTAIFFILLAFQGATTPFVQGLSWGLGSRDTERDRSVLQGRLDRSVRNHIESMMIFVPLMLVAHIADLSSDLIFWGAVIYLVGRAVFPILYVAGVPVLRSIVWGISVAGLALIGFEVVKAAL